MMPSEPSDHPDGPVDVAQEAGRGKLALDAMGVQAARLRRVSERVHREVKRLETNLQAAEQLTHEAEAYLGHPQGDGPPAMAGADSKRLAVALRRATDPNFRLQGEDPTTNSKTDAEQWVTAYSQLLKLKTDLLTHMLDQMPRLSDQARSELAEADVILLEVQCARYAERLEYWRLLSESLRQA